MAKKRKNIVDRASEYPVTFEDLKTAFEAVDRMPEEDRSNEVARTFALMNAFFDPSDPKSGLGQGCVTEESIDSGDKLCAITWRMEALARLVDEHPIKGWTMPSDREEMTFISHDMLRVAAVQPLRTVGKKKIFFEYEPFRRKLLELTDTEGQA